MVFNKDSVFCLEEKIVQVMNKSVKIYNIFKKKRVNSGNEIMLLIIINYYFNCFNIQNEVSRCVVR